MKWIKFLVVNILIFVVLWGLAIYAYGDFYLADNVVPEADVEIDEWLSAYYEAGAVTAVIGFICSTIWFYFGTRYSGGAGISLKHTILWLIAFIAGFAAAFIFILPAEEGSGLSLCFAGLLAPVGYYLNSLFNSEESVKYIPPLGEHIHG